MTTTSPLERRKWVLASLLCALAALVANVALAANAAPLGVEIGAASYEQVKAKLGSVTELRDGGTNKFSGGKVLASTGKGLDVDGLVRILFIFDRADVLQGVVMTLNQNFHPTYEILRKKYKLVSKQTPPVGPGYAKFAQGSSLITLEAPTMSFEMTLSYLSKSLIDLYKSKAADEKVQHDKAQQDKL
jgi:hypothetical protein